MNLLRLHQIGAKSKNLEETKSFYEDLLGGKYIAKFDPPGILFFDFSGVRIIFERGNPKATLYFWVDDIDSAHSELVQKGVKFDSEPHCIHRDEAGTFGVPGEEEWMAFFKDPGDNTIALATRR